MKSELKKLRERLLRKKPEFRRHLYHRFMKFQNKDSWRKPKGNDNKMRLKLKGYPPIVKAGYRNPVVIRELHPTGLKPVIVSSINELDKLNSSEHIIILSSTLGLRKRIKIVKTAREKGFTITNAGGLHLND